MYNVEISSLNDYICQQLSYILSCITWFVFTEFGIEHIHYVTSQKYYQFIKINSQCETNVAHKTFAFNTFKVQVQHFRKYTYSLSYQEVWFSSRGLLLNEAPANSWLA